jgi:hypothetical protein
MKFSVKGTSHISLLRTGFRPNRDRERHPPTKIERVPRISFSNDGSPSYIRYNDPEPALNHFYFKKFILNLLMFTLCVAPPVAVVQPNKRVLKA